MSQIIARYSSRVKVPITLYVKQQNLSISSWDYVRAEREDWWQNGVYLYKGMLLRGRRPCLLAIRAKNWVTGESEYVWSIAVKDIVKSLDKLHIVVHRYG